MFVNKLSQHGEIWSTWHYPRDPQLSAVTGGSGAPNWSAPFGVYPAVIDFAGTQLKLEYVTPALGLTLGGVDLAPANGADPHIRGNLGNYAGLVSFSVFVSAISWAFNPGETKTMKVVLYASPVGSNAVTRYWAECAVPA